MKREYRLLGIFAATILLNTGCTPLPTSSTANQNSNCASGQLTTSAGSQGIAQVFVTDPISSSKNPHLTPKTPSLDDYRVPVTLSHLSGQGILKGTNVEIRNRISCNDHFGAYDANNQFSYSHQDSRFQEAMTYYYGDLFQNSIRRLGFLQAKQPIRIIVHCDYQDNAYFAHGYDSAGTQVAEVCLGDSVSTPGAYYSDDAVVTLHELQHSTTLDNYSLNQMLNQFWYDEAGALNEGISDFMALVFTNSLLPKEIDLDHRIFSRWALGTFDPKGSRLRGAHRCPQYDSTYPDCKHYPSFGLSKTETTSETRISYVYPDGMGWNYADRYGGLNSASQTYLKSTSQEEIHNAGVLITGALWDIYTSLQENHPDQAVDLVTQWVMESVRNLPVPNLSSSHSPVNFPGFANKLIETMDRIPGLTSADKASAFQMLKDRGLADAPQLTEGWLDIGSGKNTRISQAPSPGLFIVDNPNTLKNWVNRMFDYPDLSFINQDPTAVTNGKLEPGEVAAIWFDLQNNQEVTAGAVLVTVTSSDPDITILKNPVNAGYLVLSGSNSSQIMYGKINGTSIVNDLTTPDGTQAIPTGNSYFKTNPYFNATWKTAIWIKVSATASHGKSVPLHIHANPSNGDADQIDFPVEIN